jgi:glycogen debranching enzyme
MAGEPGVQLTWMDAKVGDWVVTPRHGKPVEIQALWYNALRNMQAWTGEARYGAMADRARESFREQFWNGAQRCLYDVINGDIRDASIRPNQIFAVSLPHSMLSHEQEAAVVDAVEQHLLTPYGLRSLAPSDPQYRGRYEGDPWHRDSAYHQGTVWPWLLGPFLTAYLKAHGHSAESREQASQWMAELRRYMENDGLGQLPEVFDGDAPHRAGGCMAQAWSVAEVLRVAVEEIAAKLETATAGRRNAISALYRR